MIKRGLVRGFTLVELLVVVAILAILSVAAYIGIERAQMKGMNEKMKDDLNAIVSALEQYKQDKGHYPDLQTEEGVILVNVDKNVLCFKADTTYAHDCSAATTAFIETQIDNAVLSKRYLQEVPTDPRTGARYVYGVTSDGKYYEVSGNWLNDDGTWSAKVVGNLGKGSEFASLIRAYNGPNFVMDGQGYLPYSPDHMAITARLEAVAGPVNVDGSSAGTGTVVKPGSTVSTGAAASVILYFSDGSVTHLDQNTTLRVLPNAEVQQNNKDGIITKIRLKLFGGKIWSKVVRLAQKSEFNVETTNSIAGVRGTEFGIDAVTNPNDPRYIVLSGSVAARRKKYSETTAADQYVVYDSSDTTVFNPATQVILNTAAVPQVFTLPTDPGAPITNVASVNASEQDWIQKSFYTDLLNNNVRPHIMNFDGVGNSLDFKIPPQSVYKITGYYPGGHQSFIFGSGFTLHDPEHVYRLNPQAFYGKGPVTFVYEDKSGANVSGQSAPAVELAAGLTLTEGQIYNLASQNGSQGVCTGVFSSVSLTQYALPLVSTNMNSTPFTASANYIPSCQKDVTAVCQWQMIPNNNGTLDQNGTLTLTPGVDLPSLTISCTYQNKTGTSPLVVYSPLHHACSLAGAYWDATAQTCWVLGVPNVGCDTTCQNPLINGTCKDASNGGQNWDDDSSNTNCMGAASALNPLAAGASGANMPFSPYFQPGLNKCYRRHSSLQNTPNLCGTTQNMSGQRRVCKCI